MAALRFGFKCSRTACTLRFKTESALVEYISFVKIRYEIPLLFSGALERNLQF